MASDRLRNELLRYFAAISPREPTITRIEYEGARIAIYTQNQELFFDRDKVARELVSLIKKRVVIRSDPDIRLPKEEAEQVIRNTLPNNFRLIFDEPLGEIVIESNDPRITSLEGSETLKNLIRETRWVIRVLREPLMQSKTMERIKQFIFWDQKDKLEILRRIGERVFRPLVFEIKDVRITVLGAGRQVGRSALLLQTTESTLLLDCGLSAGASAPIDMFPRFDVMPDLVEWLDAVVISHAHLDHAGLVPFLFKYGYRGPVYCVEPTVPLMALEQLDYISVAGKEGVFAPYTENEVKLALQHTQPLKYGVVTNVTPDVRITFYNAGHILGSGIVHIHVGEGLHNIVYSGDFKFEKTRTLDASNYRFPRAETLIMESTYGATPVPFTREESENIFAEYITNTVNKGGKVLIPVPAIGRAQEIMLVLNSLFEEGKLVEVPVFLDGLVIEATAIHTAFPDYLAGELQQRLRSGENIFLSEYFTPIKSQSQREEVLNSQGPAVIISTSGMLEGGPILKYLRGFADDEKNLLLFVSYQVEGTLGRKILKGVREVTLIDEEGRSELLQVRMQVQKVDGFSGHSSRQQLLNYLCRITPRPRNIILVHGEEEAIQSLANAASKIMPANIYAPRNLETIVLHQS
ncbi:MAG: beta-CASP ribonuclease aCPSF1 [Aigarchaeota archaeon]|nr:beta-CASP ribonuclease aCPSF1 [Candidatus Pelearchaeum maunauluense]